MWLHLIRVGNIDGGHVEATLVESWTLAKLLHNLHHNSLKSPITKQFDMSLLSQTKIYITVKMLEISLILTINTLLLKLLLKQ